MSEVGKAACLTADSLRRPPLLQQSVEQLFYPDVDPWQQRPDHGYFNVSPDAGQQRDSYNPNVGTSQAQPDLNVADPSAQALLRFLMQSDYEFSMR